MDGDDHDNIHDVDNHRDEQMKNSGELEAEFVECLKTIEILKSEKADLKKQIKDMQWKFQRMLATAEAEIKSKDQQILQLRKERVDKPICDPRYQRGLRLATENALNLVSKNTTSVEPRSRKVSTKDGSFIDKAERKYYHPRYRGRRTTFHVESLLRAKASSTRRHSSEAGIRVRSNYNDRVRNCFSSRRLFAQKESKFKIAARSIEAEVNKKCQVPNTFDIVTAQFQDKMPTSAHSVQNCDDPIQPLKIEKMVSTEHLKEMSCIVKLTTLNETEIAVESEARKSEKSMGNLAAGNDSLNSPRKKSVMDGTSDCSPSSEPQKLSSPNLNSSGSTTTTASESLTNFDSKANCYDLSEHPTNGYTSDNPNGKSVESSGGSTTITASDALTDDILNSPRNTQNYDAILGCSPVSDFSTDQKQLESCKNNGGCSATNVSDPSADTNKVSIKLMLAAAKLEDYLATTQDENGPVENLDRPIKEEIMSSGEYTPTGDTVFYEIVDTSECEADPKLEKEDGIKEEISTLPQEQISPNYSFKRECENSEFTENSISFVCKEEINIDESEVYNANVTKFESAEDTNFESLSCDVWDPKREEGENNEDNSKVAQTEVGMENPKLVKTELEYCSTVVSVEDEVAAILQYFSSDTAVECGDYELDPMTSHTQVVKSSGNCEDTNFKILLRCNSPASAAESHKNSFQSTKLQEISEWSESKVHLNNSEKEIITQNEHYSAKEINNPSETLTNCNDSNTSIDNLDADDVNKDRPKLLKIDANIAANSVLSEPLILGTVPKNNTDLDVTSLSNQVRHVVLSADRSHQDNHNENYETENTNAQEQLSVPSDHEIIGERGTLKEEAQIKCSDESPYEVQSQDKEVRNVNLFDLENRTMHAIGNLNANTVETIIQPLEAAGPIPIINFKAAVVAETNVENIKLLEQEKCAMKGHENFPDESWSETMTDQPKLLTQEGRTKNETDDKNVNTISGGTEEQVKVFKQTDTTIKEERGLYNISLSDFMVEAVREKLIGNIFDETMEKPVENHRLTEEESKNHVTETSDVDTKLLKNDFYATDRTEDIYEGIVGTASGQSIKDEMTNMGSPINIGNEKESTSKEGRANVAESAPNSPMVEDYMMRQCNSTGQLARYLDAGAFKEKQTNDLSQITIVDNEIEDTITKTMDTNKKKRVSHSYTDKFELPLCNAAEEQPDKVDIVINTDRFAGTEEGAEATEIQTINDYVTRHTSCDTTTSSPSKDRSVKCYTEVMTGEVNEDFLNGSQHEGLTLTLTDAKQAEERDHITSYVANNQTNRISVTPPQDELPEYSSRNQFDNVSICSEASEEVKGIFAQSKLVNDRRYSKSSNFAASNSADVDQITPLVENSLYIFRPIESIPNQRPLISNERPANKTSTTQRKGLNKKLLKINRFLKLDLSSKRKHRKRKFSEQDKISEERKSQYYKRSKIDTSEVKREKKSKISLKDIVHKDKDKNICMDENNKKILPIQNMEVMQKREQDKPTKKKHKKSQLKISEEAFLKGNIKDIQSDKRATNIEKKEHSCIKLSDGSVSKYKYKKTLSEKYMKDTMTTPTTSTVKEKIDVTEPDNSTLGHRVKKSTKQAAVKLPTTSTKISGRTEIKQSIHKNSKHVPRVLRPRTKPRNLHRRILDSSSDEDSKPSTSGKRSEANSASNISVLAPRVKRSRLKLSENNQLDIEKGQ